MDEQWKTVWAVEWQNGGRTERFLDYSRHTTPEEAREAFAEVHGIAWAIAEQQGARVVQQQVLFGGSKPSTEQAR